MKDIWKFIVSIFWSMKNIAQSAIDKTYTGDNNIVKKAGQVTSHITALIATFLICSGSFLFIVIESFSEQKDSELEEYLPVSESAETA